MKVFLTLRRCALCLAVRRPPIDILLRGASGRESLKGCGALVGIYSFGAFQIGKGNDMHGSRRCSKLIGDPSLESRILYPPPLSPIVCVAAFADRFPSQAVENIGAELKRAHDRPPQRHARHILPIYRQIDLKYEHSAFGV